MELVHGCQGDTAAHLAVEVGEGADGLTDTNEEERGEGWGHQEVIERGHQVVLDLKTQLCCVQERVLEVVARAEDEDGGGDGGTVLKHRDCV